jgi:osmotically-inducible protein OsmY
MGGGGMGNRFGQQGQFGNAGGWERDEQQRRGRHFGRGPKGYMRSDERIREDVSEMLFRHDEVDASEIEVQVKEGDVTLTGSVESREARRMAEECIWDVSGVKNVTNMLRIEKNGHDKDVREGREREETTRGRRPTAH